MSPTHCCMVKAQQMLLQFPRGRSLLFTIWYGVKGKLDFPLVSTSPLKFSLPSSVIFARWQTLALSELQENAWVPLVPLVLMVQCPLRKRYSAVIENSPSDKQMGISEGCLSKPIKCTTQLKQVFYASVKSKLNYCHHLSWILLVDHCKARQDASWQQGYKTEKKAQ